jgi:lipid II:glycine glycyltransferase (peptidoglycan interpeptide bridge formation enzyme)
VGAYSETNDLCAGAFFVYSNKKVIFYFSATDETAKANGAMPLLIDHFIRKHANAHITLDFEGSNDPGLARFYKSFGANEVTYPHYKINKLNPLFKLGLKLVKKITG